MEFDPLIFRSESGVLTNVLLCFWKWLLYNTSYLSIRAKHINYVFFPRRRGGSCSCKKVYIGLQKQKKGRICIIIFNSITRQTILPDLTMYITWFYIPYIGTFSRHDMFAKMTVQSVFDRCVIEVYWLGVFILFCHFALRSFLLV